MSAIVKTNAKTRRIIKRLLVWVAILIILGMSGLTSLCMLLGKNPFAWYQYARMSLEGIYGYLSSNIVASLQNTADVIQNPAMPETTLVSPPAIIRAMDGCQDTDQGQMQMALFVLDENFTILDSDGNRKGTFSEALECVGQNIIPCFQIDSVYAATELCGELSRLNWTDAFAVSPYPDLLKLCADLNPDIGRVLLTKTGSAGEIYMQMLACKANTVLVPEKNLSDELTDYLHRRGLFCWVYGIKEDIDAVAKAVFVGTDGIVLENPTIAWSYMEIFCEKPVLRMKPIVVAHRGVSHNSDYPENTIRSLSAAVDMGVGVIEGDMELTSDGALVVFHDDTIDRLLEGTGKISDYTLAELQQIPMRADKTEFVLSVEEYVEAALLQYPDEDIVFSFEPKNRYSEQGYYAMLEILDEHPEYYQNIIINNFTSRDLVHSYLGDIRVREHMTGEVLPTGWANNSELANILKTTRRESIWWTRLTHGVPWYSFDQICDELYDKMYLRSVPLLIGWQDDKATVINDILKGLSIFTGNVSILEDIAWGLDAADLVLDRDAVFEISVSLNAFAYGKENVCPKGYLVLSKDAGLELSFYEGKLNVEGPGMAVIQWYYDCLYNGVEYRIYSAPIKVTAK